MSPADGHLHGLVLPASSRLAASDGTASDDTGGQHTEPTSHRVERGAVLPLWATLGSSPHAAVGTRRRGAAPSSTGSTSSTGTGATGFETRWADDLEMLAAHGVGHVRITLDWSRLQPRPSALDGDAVEWYRNVLDHARSLGIAPWVTLLERDVPQWFDDEQGFADPKASGRWWPRWVETAADAVGDLVAGWHPIDDPLRHADRAARLADGSADAVRHGEVLDTLVVAWRDAWRILRGGPPVATALRVGAVHPADHTVEAVQEARRRDHLMWTLWLRGLRDGSVVIPGRADRELADLAGAADVIGVGVSLSRRDLPAGRITDETLAQLNDRIGHHLRRAAETAPDRPMHVSSVRFPAHDLADRAHLLGAVVDAIDDACDDGVPVRIAFAEPAIDALGPGAGVAQSGLFTLDREPTPALERWVD